MRKVEVKVWTDSLGHMKVTPVLKNDDENMQILRDADGNYDDDVIDAIEESPDICGLETYLMDTERPNSITVIEENGETEYENVIDDYCIDADLISCLIRDDVDLDNPSEESKEKFFDDYGIELLDYVKIMHSDVVGEDGQLPSLLFEKIKNKDKSLGENGFMLSHIRSLIEEFYMEENIDEQKCLLSFGDVGRGSVSYHIWLEDDEEFDINKLHFFSVPYWWDCHIYKLSKELCDLFETTDVLLDFIEYNGKIYNIFDIPSVLWYNYKGKCVLMNPKMEAVELD